ncbi:MULTISPECIES: hypothetical protein [Halolamina]|uniref:Uncharacterized protein n=1 Tax=Halolamina pelagica TaxID=699431 RepID=A0A1I5ULV6_9EURY|nr:MULTISPECIES: hypothetical protein [Halolamina]SFP96303.1 hypothetical protein SAMN05216277_11338 [Halolamina pelagica]
MSGRRLRTVVADTSALVSLAVASADAAADSDIPGPFQYLLTSCDVFVPTKVVTELRDITQYQDNHGVAANNGLAARGHYTAEQCSESVAGGKAERIQRDRYGSGTVTTCLLPDPMSTAAPATSSTTARTEISLSRRFHQAKSPSQHSQRPARETTRTISSRRQRRVPILHSLNTETRQPK